MVNVSCNSMLGIRRYRTFNNYNNGTAAAAAPMSQRRLCKLQPKEEMSELELVQGEVSAPLLQSVWLDGSYGMLLPNWTMNNTNVDICEEYSCSVKLELEVFSKMNHIFIEEKKAKKIKHNPHTGEG